MIVVIYPMSARDGLGVGECRLSRLPRSTKPDGDFELK